MPENRISAIKIIPTASKFAAASLLILSVQATAGEVTVTWSDPAKFTDIVASNSTDKAYRKSIENALNAEFKAQAAKLPDGQKMAVNITDIDLAGEVDPIPSRAGQRVRVLRDVYYPQLRFDYKITGKDGGTVKEQAGVTLKDAGFLSGSGNASSRQDFYYERQMIKTWFGKDILAKPQ
jgi:hypothetical protein